AAVAGRSVQEPALVLVLGRVLGTNRVIGAKAAQVNRVPEVPGEMATGLYQAPHGAFGVGRSGVEQDPVAVTSGVDSLADRACRVTAFQGHGGNQEVRQRMEQDEGKADELAGAFVVLFPAFVAGRELTASPLDCRLPKPRVDRLAAELNEDPLASILDGRQPGGFSGERCAGHSDFELALGVGRG